MIEHRGLSHGLVGQRVGHAVIDLFDRDAIARQVSAHFLLCLRSLRVPRRVLCCGRTEVLQELHEALASSRWVGGVFASAVVRDEVVLRAAEVLRVRDGVSIRPRVEQVRGDLFEVHRGDSHLRSTGVQREIQLVRCGRSSPRGDRLREQRAQDGQRDGRVEHHASRGVGEGSLELQRVVLGDLHEQLGRGELLRERRLCDRANHLRERLPTVVVVAELVGEAGRRLSPSLRRVALEAPARAGIYGESNVLRDGRSDERAEVIEDRSDRPLGDGLSLVSTLGDERLDQLRARFAKVALVFGCDGERGYRAIRERLCGAHGVGVDDHRFVGEVAQRVLDEPRRGREAQESSGLCAQRVAGASSAVLVQRRGDRAAGDRSAKLVRRVVKEREREQGFIARVWERLGHRRLSRDPAREEREQLTALREGRRDDAPGVEDLDREAVSELDSPRLDLDRGGRRGLRADEVELRELDPRGVVDRQLAAALDELRDVVIELLVPCLTLARVKLCCHPQPRLWLQQHPRIDAFVPGPVGVQDGSPEVLAQECDGDRLELVRTEGFDDRDPFVEVHRGPRTVAEHRVTRDPWITGRPPRARARRARAAR